MRLPQPLAHGRLAARYKRFFADVILDDGSAVCAHCANPGAMLGLAQPGLGVWLSRANGPNRRLEWSLELVEADGGLVGINTLSPNRLVAEALEADLIPELTGYDRRRREAPMGRASRVDFLLEAEGRPRLWLEVKNCHLRRAGSLAEFPDCRAARAEKHMGELAARVREGDRAAVLFVIQRTDCDRFVAAADFDPAFATALNAAQDEGVEALAWACEISPEEIRLAHPVPCGKVGC
ncbi:MAG: DNA/RNA nuclease SfsA [Caulobacteraceae bacterium]